MVVRLIAQIERRIEKEKRALLREVALIAERERQTSLPLALFQLEVGGEVGRKTGCAKCFQPGGMVLYRCPFARYTGGVLPGETVVFS